MNISKNELRQKYRALRDSFGEEFIETASRIACENIAKCEEFVSADTVLLYYPTKNEISPLHLLEVCLKMGKRVAFPVCQKDTTTLIFKSITNLMDLSCSSFGILEPNDDCQTIIPSQNTFCVVPALIFARDGHRLGYGKGYYDRFLEKFEGTSAGISYSACVLDFVPHEEHDIPINLLITESEVLKIAQKN